MPDLPLPTPPPPELRGWKDIAAYLRVSVRTAQNMEKDLALPVRRGPGVKGQVFALPAELDRWKAGLISGPEVLVTPELNPRIASRRRWLSGAIAAAAGLCGLGYAAARLWPRDRHPVSWAIEGSALVVFDRSHAVLWRHTLADTMGKGSVTAKVVFADLDGDGRMETLFGYQTEVGLQCTVWCLDALGRPRWSFRPGKPVTAIDSAQYSPPFMLHALAVIPAASSRAAHVLVVSIHHWSYPCQVAVLDSGTGKLIGEYWHRGHLKPLDVADIDGDGRPEVLLAGVNDALDYKRATLVIFDSANIAGCSRDPAGHPYFQGMPPGTEKYEVLFPRTVATEGHEFNIATGIHAYQGRIEVNIEEAGPVPDPHASYWTLYELDDSLRPTNVLLSYDLQHLYLTAPLEPSAAGPLAAVAASLKSHVLVIRRPPAASTPSAVTPRTKI